MRRLFSVVAGMTVAAALAGGGTANALGNDPAFDAGSFDSLKRSGPGILIPEPAAPAPADKRRNSQRESSGQGSVPVHAYTLRQEKIMGAHNGSLRNSSVKSEGKPVSPQYRPYADYEEPGYLIMSSDFSFDSRRAKLEMAKNLPADAFLVIFAGNASETTKAGILRDYESVIPRRRIKVISLPSSRQGFWARDGIPVPVLGRDNRLTVVDAKYGHGFEPDAEISRLFKTGLEKHDYYFEGGNFQANHAGDCLIVNHGHHVGIPDDIFSGLYGCRRLIRLPFINGIGHVDERARFINEKTIVTDTPVYKEILEGEGFTVHLLPKPAGRYETYVNSLILNDRVVGPVFDEPTDAQALAVYEKLGLITSGANSVTLSNSGMGSVHCITMTYPKVSMTELTKALGAQEF